VPDRIDGYAAAILELAAAEGEAEVVEREMHTLARTMESSAELRDAISDPRLPVERQRAILDDLLGGRASDTTVNLVGFIAAQGLASSIPAIADRLVTVAAAGRQSEVAEVRTAVPLDDATIARLAEVLGRATGKRLEVKVVVDPTVVGGVVARVGDTVIDGSVRRRLDSLRSALQTR
jgi:F-type H+-transporting ATPase subunit delta